ncbi:PoNe immunity protein domain-containing protein [Cupriavidus taiwanensis]|uniref:PoNe immunity protein domain-containing protein n=1 Tax=Cupriavidus taiwanensis TaxID=164546 RepID=UPI000E10CD15|nr:PoNe immunity protein domain-containing protein [Cupriavidus taiwanensis]SPA31249.1 conserved hypothetical protein [Cupriavidus taiwanensis]SPA56482.1 conserved protein of unknown function [Cupriavidus taiwanensis]
MATLNIISESAFKNRRDLMLDIDAYIDLMDDAKESQRLITDDNISKRIRESPDQNEAITAVMGGTRQKAWDYLTALHAQYSAGGSLDSLRAFFPEVVGSWKTYAEYHTMFHRTPNAGGRKVPHLDLYDKDYWFAIRLTSFAILLGHSTLLPSIAALWDYENEDMDGLLERLVAPYLPNRGTPPDTCTRHLPYFKTLKIFDASVDERAALMSSYLDEWYKASRREPYYDSHTKGRNHNYLGYWSFEAAAISVILDIDDEGFRKKPFYPADLAQFGRQQKSVALEAITDSSMAHLHSVANSPCPKAGYWMTPAKAGSRRYFRQGETMPVVATDYGTTIWQWDIDQSDPGL